MNRIWELFFLAIVQEFNTMGLSTGNQETSTSVGTIEVFLYQEEAVSIVVESHQNFDRQSLIFTQGTVLSYTSLDYNHTSSKELRYTLYIFYSMLLIHLQRMRYSSHVMTWNDGVSSAI